jgi:hypothetical protein
MQNVWQNVWYMSVLVLIQMMTHAISVHARALPQPVLLVFTSLWLLTSQTTLHPTALPAAVVPLDQTTTQQVRHASKVPGKGLPTANATLYKSYGAKSYARHMLVSRCVHDTMPALSALQQIPLLGMAGYECC